MSTIGPNQCTTHAQPGTVIGDALPEQGWASSSPVKQAEPATAIPRTLAAISDSLDLMDSRMDSLTEKLSKVMPGEVIAGGDVPGPPMGTSPICNQLARIHARIQVLSARIDTLDTESEL